MNGSCQLIVPEIKGAEKLQRADRRWDHTTEIVAM
uniref:Uncharacterized protein n=1 Tax=Oryza barthii TaxID=65489 RepID=A0A0D3HJ76_9ORYZ